MYRYGIIVYKHIIPWYDLYIQPSPWRWTLRFETYRRHHKNYSISLTKVHFVGLYYMIILQCTVWKIILKN